MDGRGQHTPNGETGEEKTHAGYQRYIPLEATMPATIGRGSHITGDSRRHGIATTSNQQQTYNKKLKRLSPILQ